MDYYQIMIYNNDSELLSLEELIAITGLSPELLRYFSEYGLIEAVERKEGTLLFDISVIPRIRMIQRLRTDVGINLAGIAIILNLRDRIEQLQRDLDWFKNF
jgi:DNA-binding transcriptional MerR regulator